MRIDRLRRAGLNLAAASFGLSLLSLGGCATPDANPVWAARKELAPAGTLQVAINFGNPILAQKNPATGEAQGVSVDLARALASRLNVPLELVTFTSAGKVDVAFVAIDPVRGADMDYTAPYVIIEGAYLVRQDSPVRSNSEVDRPGHRVVVGLGSAYDLFLTRELRQATLVRAPTSPAVTDMFIAQNLDVAAGVRQQLEADARRVPGLRLLDGRFMVIEQAMATPKGREAGVSYLRRFVEDMKRSGFVADALYRHKIEGAAVAPAAGL